MSLRLVPSRRVSCAFRVALICLLVSPAALAGKLYKYVDANGVTHYSDRPPAEAEPAEVETLHYRAESKNYASLRLEQTSDNGRLARAVNALDGPIEIALTYSSHENILSSPELPLTQVVPAHGDVVLAQFRVDNPARGARFELSMDAVPGDPHAKPEDVDYMLPVPADSGWRVDQGFNGNFSHQDDQSRYAVDFHVDEGTPIRAARGGTVMQVEDDFEGAGLNREKFGSRANYIRILHSDGSMALYAHLSVDSVKVRTGQRVSSGQVIGASGNTGFSTGPHLHFAVQANRGMSLQSIPFRMSGPKGPLSLGSP